jgi:hypothetical protein
MDGGRWEEGMEYRSWGGRGGRGGYAGEVSGGGGGEYSALVPDLGENDREG